MDPQTNTSASRFVVCIDGTDNLAPKWCASRRRGKNSGNPTFNTKGKEIPSEPEENVFDVYGIHEL